MYAQGRWCLWILVLVTTSAPYLHCPVQVLVVSWVGLLVWDGCLFVSTAVHLSLACMSYTQDLNGQRQIWNRQPSRTRSSTQDTTRTCTGQCMGQWIWRWAHMHAIYIHTHTHSHATRSHRWFKFMFSCADMARLTESTCSPFYCAECRWHGTYILQLACMLFAWP